jgi:23S rRNA pseudouridine2457 synthase
MSRVILLNKPFGVLTTFTDPEGRPCLADFVDIPKVYAAGRLDRDSEGLLVLTDDGALQHSIAHPSTGKSKGYWVQVERVPSEAALEQLRRGVAIKSGVTKPAKAHLIDPPTVWDRDPPVRFRKAVPTAWIDLSITEGMNRQVRRMTAAVGHPCLRLIRYRVGDFTLRDLMPGDWREG